MDTLDKRSGGFYTVTTLSASYLVDLDRMLLSRTADEPDLEWRRLRRDDEPVRLLDLVRCRIGEPMVVNIDLRAPGVLSTCRTTTTVVGIQALSSPAPALTDPDAETKEPS